MDEKSYNIKLTEMNMSIAIQAIEKMQILGKDAIIVADLLKKIKITWDKSQADKTQ